MKQQNMMFKLVNHIINSEQSSLPEYIDHLLKYHLKQLNTLNFIELTNGYNWIPIFKRNNKSSEKQILHMENICKLFVNSDHDLITFMMPEKYALNDEEFMSWITNDFVKISASMTVTIIFAWSLQIPKENISLINKYSHKLSQINWKPIFSTNAVAFEYIEELTESKTHHVTFPQLQIINRSLPLISYSATFKRYKTFGNYDGGLNATSAPIEQLVATPCNVKTLYLDTRNDVDTYKKYLLFCPKLIVDCNCKCCNPPRILSPLTSPFNTPLSLIKYIQSDTMSNYSSPFVDARYALYNDCEQTKNLSLIHTIGMGLKNCMPRLLSILNDINSRLLLEEYKSQNDFYTFNNNLISEDEPNISEEEDDDDVDIIDVSIHKAFVDLKRLSKSYGEY
eukprot:262491_1